MQSQRPTKTAITHDEPAKLAMTVFRLRNLDHWQDRIDAAVTDAGFRVLRKGPKLHLWDPANIMAVPRKPLRYVDGVKLVRQWLGKGLGAVGILPKRMYFEAGSDISSAKPEWMLMGDANSGIYFVLSEYL